MPAFGSYHKILREERHLGAILYHFLQDSTGLENFLEAVKASDPTQRFACDASQVRGIYYEYAALRDIWKSISDCFKESGSLKEELPETATVDWIKRTLGSRDYIKHDPESFSDADWVKREFILAMLIKVGAKRTASYLRKISSSSNVSENRKALNSFVAKKSSTYSTIQSPSNWGAGTIAHELLCAGISEPDELKREVEKTLMFKWSFNIKPDIVMELAGDSVLCVELKYESGESYYPSSKDKQGLKKPLKEGGISIQTINQIALQKFMLTEVLGFRHCEQVQIAKPNTRKILGVRRLTWGQAFNSLTKKSCSPLRPEVQTLIDRITKKTK